MQSDDAGASAVEYGMLIAAIATVLVVGVSAFGSVVTQAFSHTSGCISAEINARC
jgi:pilus assembly protein Flp/PilA